MSAARFGPYEPPPAVPIPEPQGIVRATVTVVHADGRRTTLDVTDPTEDHRRRIEAEWATDAEIAVDEYGWPFREQRKVGDSWTVSLSGRFQPYKDPTTSTEAMFSLYESPNGAPSQPEIDHALDTLRRAGWRVREDTAVGHMSEGLGIVMAAYFDPSAKKYQRTNVQQPWQEETP